MKHSLPKQLARFLFFLVSLSCAAQNRPAFEAEILAFEAKDKLSPPPRKAIVFTGSSSVRLWADLEKDFAGKAVLNRGFGGSQLSDVIRYADRIIIPYKPKQVVIYAGENDIASGTVTAQQTYDRFVTLFRQIRKALPKTQVTFIAIKPSPSRRKYLPVVVEANRLIESFLKQQKRTSFVDVYTPMLTASGGTRGELFRADSLHMNRKGYEIWAGQVRPYLK